MKRISQPYQISRHEVRISASIGIALYPGDGQTRHELMINADAAMYHAKDQGRNGYCFFESSMNANAQEQLQLLHDLRQALSAGSWSCTTNPRYWRRTDRWSAWKRCCAGSIRNTD